MKPVYNMPHFLVTYSPNNSVVNDEMVGMFVDIFLSFLENECALDHYRVVTSYGEAGNHYHFHAHIVGYTNQARTFRKQFERYMRDEFMAEDMPNIFFSQRFWVQRTKGTTTEVFEYLNKNVGEHPKGDMYKEPIDVCSTKYHDYVVSSVHADRVLSDRQFFTKFMDILTEDAKLKPLTRDHVLGVFLSLQKLYYTHRIRPDVLDRICDDGYKLVEKSKLA